MAKLTYVEPSGYFTASAKKILKEGEKKASSKKSSSTKTTAKKSTKK